MLKSLSDRYITLAFYTGLSDFWRIAKSVIYSSVTCRLKYLCVIQVINDFISDDLSRPMTCDAIATFLASYGHKAHLGGVMYPPLLACAKEVHMKLFAKAVKRKSVTRVTAPKKRSKAANPRVSSG